MLRALLFGLIASSALVVGASRGRPGVLVAVGLAFASGALATDLFAESFRTGGALLSQA